MRGTGIKRVPGDIVITAQRRLTLFWGACAVILVLGLVAAWDAQPATAGKAEAAVFFAIFIALCGVTWWYQNRRRPRIQVTPDEIRYWSQGGHLTFTLRRAPAGLCLVPALHCHEVARSARLTVPGSGAYMSLRYFQAPLVRRACESAGWRLDGDQGLLASDARAMWHDGRLAEAAHLVDTFGPFDVDGDGLATASQGAAILEAWADHLASRDREAASAAYRRAAGAQRSYAAFATSGAEGSARMAEADRLDAKARP
jgi:hypothetical protein